MRAGQSPPDLPRRLVRFVRSCPQGFHSETFDNLLIELMRKTDNFSEYVLIQQTNSADFDSAIPRFESWRPSHIAVHKCSQLSAFVRRTLNQL
jgi:hypothetical protein